MQGLKLQRLIPTFESHTTFGFCLKESKTITIQYTNIRLMMGSVAVLQRFQTNLLEAGLRPALRRNFVYGRQNHIPLQNS